MTTETKSRSLNKSQVFMGARIAHRGGLGWEGFLSQLGAEHGADRVDEMAILRVLASLRAGTQIDSCRVVLLPWGQTAEKGATMLISASAPPNSTKFDPPRVYQVADPQRNLPRFAGEPAAPALATSRPKSDIIADLLD